jgi:chitinase
MYLPEDGYLLTAASPAGKSVLEFVHPAESATYLNFINLAAYDFFGSWTIRTGHQSQLYSMRKDDTSGAAGVS